MFCARCGTPNPDGSRFCASCGAPLDASHGAGPQASPAAGGTPPAPAARPPRCKRVPRAAIIALALLASVALGGLAGWGIVAATGGGSAGVPTPSGGATGGTGTGGTADSGGDKAASVPDYLLIDYYNRPYGEIEKGLLDAGFTLDSIDEYDDGSVKATFHADTLGLTGEPSVENAAIIVYVDVSDPEQYAWRTSPASPDPTVALPDDAPCSHCSLWWDIDSSEDELVSTVQRNIQELKLGDIDLLSYRDEEIGDEAAKAFDPLSELQSDSYVLRLRGGVYDADEPFDNKSDKRPWWDLTVQKGGDTADYFGSLDYHYPIDSD